jgi:tRNA A37 N6-isopentenylltransferase MiaA
MELDRYEDAIKAFGDAFSAFNKKRDDDFDAAINTADRDDYAPGAYEAQFRNHKNCGYRLEEFNELMKNKCKPLVNASKYKEAIKVAYDGLNVANSLSNHDLESYFFAVDSSLEAMGKHGIAEELYNKYSEALAANENCECKKACYKLCSAVWRVKNQLNIK